MFARMSVVSYVCVEGLAVPRFTAYGKNATSSATYYYFRLESQCACEAGCQGNGDKRYVPEKYMSYFYSSNSSVNDTFK